MLKFTKSENLPIKNLFSFPIDDLDGASVEGKRFPKAVFEIARVGEMRVLGIVAEHDEGQNQQMFSHLLQIQEIEKGKERVRGD